jgi:hypothetical protein
VGLGVNDGFGVIVAVRVIVEVGCGVFVGTEAKVEHDDNTRKISKMDNKSLGLS